MTTNRKEIRAKLAEELAVAMASAQTVYDHMKGGFSGQSPVVRIMSGGSNRQRLTATAGKAEFLIVVQLWVLYSDKTNSWTEQDAEERLDDLEHELAVYVQDNRANGVWKSVDFAGMSRTDTVMFEGNPYLVEDVQLTVKVY